MTQLAKEYNVSRPTIATYLKNNQIPIKSLSDSNRKYNVNHNCFNEISNEENAYFLGLLCADGCNNEKDGVVTISLQEGDKDILEKLQSFLETNKPLKFINKRKYNPIWKDLYAVDIVSKHISSKLASLGCFARKSLTLQFPTEEQVPAHLIRHFIRGYFDGNGCISFTRHRSKNKLDCCVGLSSTVYFGDIYSSIVNNHLGVNCTSYDDADNGITKSVRFYGVKNAIAFYEWIYKDATVYLLRKYNKFIALKEMFDK